MDKNVVHKIQINLELTDDPDLKEVHEVVEDLCVQICDIASCKPALILAALELTKLNLYHNTQKQGEENA